MGGFGGAGGYRTPEDLFRDLFGGGGGGGFGPFGFAGANRM